MKNQKETLKLQTKENKVDIPEGMSHVPVLFFDDRVLIENIPPPEVEKGVHRPANAKNQFEKGRVISIGTGIFNNESILKQYNLKLDMVVGYFANGAMNWEDVDDKTKKFHLVRASDIFAVL